MHKNQVCFSREKNEIWFVKKNQTCFGKEKKMKIDL